jgi:excinuclease ABC subunit C
VELASKNARMVLGKEAGPDQHLHQLQEQLGLPEFPSIIEGIDISNTGGDEAVGSLVVFEKGRPRKDLYRKYRIKSVEGPDDVRCIAEVVHRRYSRLQKEASPLPNLILIDGGKGQLNAARRALKELGLGNRPLISLAKREETIFSPRHWNGVQLNPSSPALRMLQFVRDEAHRFAVSYHRRRRSQKSLGSLLDHIQGIGPRRKSALLKKYRGLDEIKLAPEADLDTLVGKIAARRLKKNLDALDLESHKQPDNNR